MPHRRQFFAGVGSLAAASALASIARAQPKLPRVGYLFSFTPAEGQQLWDACRQGLRELGYSDGQNIILEPRWAHGDHSRLPALAAELVSLKVDVIVTAATPASRAAKAATGSIPIVIVAVGEPVKVGLVASLSRPSGNITGLSLLTPEMSGKRLELLTEVLGNLVRLTAVLNPDNPVSAVFYEETDAAARKLGIELARSEARNVNEIEQAFADVRMRRPSALVVFDDPVLWTHRARIVTLAAEARVPVMYGYTDFVREGGLMSYGPNRPDQYRRTASYVDKILKGAKPADLPVEQPTKFELFINVKTIKALGLAVSPMLLARADEVIE